MNRSVVVTSSGLKMHEIASTAGHVVDELNRGDELSVIGERTSISGNHWLRVHVLRTGDQGWVDASYTKPKEPLPPPVHQTLPPSPYWNPPEPPHKKPPKTNWDAPASSWNIPNAPSPTKTKWEWLWVVGAVLIIVGLLLLFRH